MPSAKSTTPRFDQEFFFELQEEDEEESIVVKMEEPGVYSVEGPKVERMLGYTNLESEKGFEFFQKFKEEFLIKLNWFFW